MASVATPIMLWSAGNWIKYTINERYFGYHFVWCSPVFEAEALSRYQVGAGQPPSSDPASIYRHLHKAVSKQDRHDNEIARQKTSIKGVALKLASEGKITSEQAAEIVTILNQAAITDWRPLIYAIPYVAVASRVQIVPLEDRASIEPEFIVPDLKQHEFHILEPMPCP